jgi:hypothetical protein
VKPLPDAPTRSIHHQLGLTPLPLPLELPEVPLYLLWHQRHDDDPAHTWLRDTATRALRALFTRHRPLVLRPQIVIMGPADRAKVAAPVCSARTSSSSAGGYTTPGSRALTTAGCACAAARTGNSARPFSSWVTDAAAAFA